MKIFKIFIPILLFTVACQTENKSNTEIKEDNLLQYVNKIRMTETEDSVFLKSNHQQIAFAKSELPLQSAMVVPTSVIAYMDALDLLDKITGINQPDFIFNPKIHSLIEKNAVEEIGTFNEIFVEKVMMNTPDVFISISGPTQAKYHEILEEQGVTVLFIDEYEELEPLARAEYVKIIGKLFGKEEEANVLFAEIEENYHNIQSDIEKLNHKKPTVLSNQIYGDIWYMPGGNSFQAKLFQDAGGDYLWSDDNSEGSLNLSFESVFEKANDADYWLNSGDFESVEELIGSYKNYEWFTAVKNGKVYNWSNKKTAKGGNDYFEAGTARPDWVLKDLAAILYPQLYPEHELYFYKKLD